MAARPAEPQGRTTRRAATAEAAVVARPTCDRAEPRWSTASWSQVVGVAAVPEALRATPAGPAAVAREGHRARRPEAGAERRRPEVRPASARAVGRTV